MITKFQYHETPAHLENIWKKLTIEKADRVLSPKCGTGERWVLGFFFVGTDLAEFTEHSAKDQGGTKLGNTHRHKMLVEKISQGRFPSCASLLVTSRSAQQQKVDIWKVMFFALYKVLLVLIKQAVAMCHADLEALLLLCGDFVLTQVSNADDQNVVFHLLRLPTMPVTLDDQRKRHKKAKEKKITPNTSRLLLHPAWCKWQLMTSRLKSRPNAPLSGSNGRGEGRGQYVC